MRRRNVRSDVRLQSLARLTKGPNGHVVGCIYCPATLSADEDTILEKLVAANWRFTLGGTSRRMVGCCPSCGDTHDALEFKQFAKGR